MDSREVSCFALWSVSGGVLHGPGPDVHDDSSVLCVRGAGGCVCVPWAVWRLLPYHDGSHSVWTSWAHAGLTGHRLPSRPHVSSDDSRSTHCWWEACFLPTLVCRWVLSYNPAERNCSSLTSGCCASRVKQLNKGRKTQGDKGMPA